MNELEHCIYMTKEHIKLVSSFMIQSMSEILKRSLVHDASKLESPELETFAEHTPKLRKSTFGSPEYNEFLVEMKVALDHHYANNSHHPQHYENGIKGMNLFDIVEMFCDWKAATMRHDDGDMTKSIEINKNRFNMSDDLVQIFLNTDKWFEKDLEYDGQEETF